MLILISGKNLEKQKKHEQQKFALKSGDLKTCSHRKRRVFASLIWQEMANVSKMHEILQSAFGENSNLGKNLRGRFSVALS